jgi:biotin carboxyl carrier protein
MRYFVTVDGEEFEIEVRQEPGKAPTARLVGGPQVVEGDDLQRIDDSEFVLHLPGKRVEILCDDLRKRGYVTVRGLSPHGPIRSVVRAESAQARAEKSLSERQNAHGPTNVSSPMPGKVVKVLVNVGDRVQVGAPLIVVEAMKMENELVAKTNGVVSAIHAAAGDTVEARVALVELDAQ